jgi:D-alanyl-D-alanine carboxypeptidase (penicillin-binding protein 5/6)
LLTVKNSFLFLFSVCWLTLCLTAFSSHAGRLPILGSEAKKEAQTTRTSRSTVISQRSCISLGSQGDISTVKQKTSAAVEVRIKEIRHLALKSKAKNICPTQIEQKISSKAAIIIDAQTGEAIFSKSADIPRQPASTIKVLTGIIAIKSLRDNELVPVSRHASGMPRSKVYLEPRKSYKADDLINAVLLASANDASVALAEKIAGSETEFAKIMTLRAKLWGAEKTICRTATGLTAEGQHSTARDLAMIFRHAMHDEEFASRMNKLSVRNSYGQTLVNHNKALRRVTGAVAGKTGYTSVARQTYVGQFTRGNGSIIVAVMGSETMWNDVKNLVEYGFNKREQLLADRGKTSTHNKQYASID